MSRSLFDEFESISKSAWEQKLFQETKVSSFETLLKFPEPGLETEPLYSANDLTSTSDPAPIIYPQNKDDNSEVKEWVNYCELEINNEYEVNKLALEALKNGATGILFKLTNFIPDFSLLLKNISLAHCTVSFIANDHDDFIEAYYEYAVSQKAYSHLTGFICLSSQRNKIYAIKKSPLNFYPILVKSNEEHTIDKLSAMLRDTQNLMINDNQLNTASSIAFELDSGNNYFLDICKIRAMRILLSHFYSAYSLDFSPESFHIITRIKTYKNEKYSPSEYLLNGGVSAMAAILGGSNSLIIETPNDSTINDKHIALNISSIMAEESHLSKTADPAAGSYYIESVTSQIVSNTWDKFIKTQS